MSRSSSAVIDSKVVELSLDNQNFEKNATTTISTVQKLQQALDFSVTGKNFDNINSSIKRVNFEPINRGLETCKSGFSALEAVAFGAFANIGRKISDATLNIMTAIPRQIVTGGKTRAMNMEQAKFQIEGLGKSWEKLKDDVDYAVAGTAYGMDVAAKAASQLIASGVEFGETFGATGSSPMAKALRGISGVAAMTSSSYEEISNIFTKTAGQGAIMGGELQQLSSRGLNVAADLAKFFNGVNDGSIQASENVTKAVKKVTTSVNTSEADIREWASKRKISFEIFSEAMDMAYGEHATKANETFAGSLTNIKAQLSKIGELFATPMMENGQKVFAKLYDVVKDIRTIIQNSKFLEGFKSLTEWVGDKLAGAFGKAHDALQNFINGKSNKTVETFRKAFGGLFNVVEEKTGLVSKLRDYFGLEETAEEAEGNSKKISGSFEAVKDTVLATIRGDYANGMERIKNLTEAGFNPDTIQGYVNELWELTGHDWSKLSDDIYAQVTAQEELQDATEGTKEEAEKPMSALEHLFSGILNIWSAVNRVIGIVKDKFLSLGSVFTGEDGIFAKAAAKFDEIGKAFNQFTIDHADDISTIFQGIIDAALLVWKTLTLVGGFIKTVFFGVLDGLGLSLSGVVVWISETISNIRKWIDENRVIETVLGGVRRAVETITGTIKRLWSAFTNLPIVKTAIESFGDAFSYLRDNFLGITTKAGKVINNFWSMLKNGVKYSKTPQQMFSNIGKAFSYLWTQINTSDIVKKFKEAFSEIREVISDFITDLGTNEDGTRNTFGKLLDGVVEFKNKIFQAFSGVDENGEKIGFFKGIKNAFTGLWNDISESGVIENIKNGLKSVWESIDEFFTNIGTNEDGSKNIFGSIWDTIKNGLTWIRDKAIEAKDAIAQFWEENEIGQKATDIWEALKTGFGDFFANLPTHIEALKGKWGEFVDRVRELGGIKFDNLGDIWTAFKETVGQYFKENDIFKPLTDAFETVKTKAGEIFTAIKETIKAKLREAGVPIDWIVEKFNNIKASLSQSWEDIKENGLFQSIINLFSGHEVKAAGNNIEKVSKKIKKSGKNFKTFFKEFKNSFKESGIGKVATKIFDFFGRIGNAILQIKPDQLWAIAKAFIAFKVVKGVWKEIKGIVEEFTGAITGLINSKANLKNAQANLLNKAAWIEIAATIAIIAYAIKQLADIKDMDKAWQALGMIAIILGSLLVVSLLLKKFAGGSEMTSIGTGLLLMSFAIAVIGLVIKELAGMEDMNQAWETLKMLGIIFGAMSAVMIIGAKLAGAQAAAFGAGMLAMAGAFVLAAAGLKILESVDFTSIINHLVDAVKAWNEGIKGIKPEDIDNGKTTELLLTLAGITAVLGAAEVVAFIGAVGEFVNGLFGNNLSLMEQFKENVKALVNVVEVWHEEMARLVRDDSTSIDGGTGGKTVQVLLELSAITAVLGSAELESFLGAVGDFLYGKMGFKGSLMKRFEENVNNLINVIKTWHTAISELDSNDVAEVYLKSFLILTALAGIEAIIAGAEIESFLGAVGDFVYGQMGNLGTLMGRFEENVNQLLNIIHTWHSTVMELDAGEVSEVYLKSFLILTTLAGIELVISGAELTAFIGAVEDFVYGKMGGSGTLMQKFGQNADILMSTIKKWHETAQTIDIPKANKLTQAVDNINSTIDYITTTAFWTNIESWFQGKENYIETFKTNAEKLGEAITNFMNAFNAEPEQVEKAEKIVSSLAKLGANIAMFVMDTGAMGEGRSNLEQFGDLLGDTDSGLGRKLSNFVDNCPDEGQLTTITTNFRSLINGLQLLSEIDLSEGDIFDDTKTQALQSSVSRLTGAMISVTGASMLSFGVDGFISAVEKISGLSFSKTDLKESGLVSNYIANVTKLTNMIASMASIDTSGVDKISGAVAKLNNTKLDNTDAGKEGGKKLTDSITNGIDAGAIGTGLNTALTSALTSIDSSGFKSAGYSLGFQISLGIRKAKDDIKLAIQSLVDGKSVASEFTSAISSALSGIDRSSLKTTGYSLGNELSLGIRKAKDDTKLAFGDIAKGGLSGVKDYKDDFVSVGKNFSSGLADGIKANKSQAINAAIQVAAEALAAAKRKLDEHSPSKEAEKIGMFFDLGLAKGLSGYSSTVYNESASVAEAAMEGVRLAAAKASDILTGDDYGAPVITPVLDLSEIKSGASKMGSLFLTSPKMGLNFNAISANTNAMHDQVTGADILSALETLGSSITNIGPSKTYNLNGITYDDGSNVANAIEMLVDATRIERRA